MPSTPSAPTPPDPVATAKAQEETNIRSATNQQQLNMVDQYTPQGSLTYRQVGNWGSPSQSSGSYSAPNIPNGGFLGKDISQVVGSLVPEGVAGGGNNNAGTPHFASYVTLSPEQQKLYELGTQTQTNLAQTGVEQSDKVRGILNTPFDLNSAINTQIFDQATKLMDPIWRQRESAAKTDLFNQGLTPGSEAYANSMRDFGDERDRAYLSAALGGRSQAMTEALANRNQPLNEITALLSGSQVSQPSFANTPQANVAPTDYAGIVGNNFLGQMSGYNANLQRQGAMMGGLGALGGAALGGWGSYNGFNGLLGKKG